jgi:hypothetical protein
MSDQGRIVDHHEFNIWRYENDAVDITCNRTDCDVDRRTAQQEAIVLARSLSEEVLECEELFSIRVYDSGLAVTNWRGDDGFVLGWQRFKWTRERMTGASYAGLMGLPCPPAWVLWLAWGLEYCAALCTAHWGVLTGRLTRKPPAPAESPVEMLQPLPENVVRLPVRPKPRS